MRGWRGCGMGSVRIRYYVTRKAWPGSRARWGYWVPCLRRLNKKTGKIEPTLMAQLGFRQVNCGEHGPDAIKIAEEMNAQWDAALAQHRAGLKPPPRKKVYPRGSVGDGYQRAIALRAAERKKKGILWTREHMG